MLEYLTILSIGFSVLAALILLVAYALFLPQMQKTRLGVAACTLLLLALGGLQLGHLAYLMSGTDLFYSRLYVLGLLTAPPMFYFFSRELLMPLRTVSAWQIAHLVPLALAFFLPPSWVVPVAFTIGAGYSLWFARAVYSLRRHVRRFRFEMFFFGLFAIIAVLVLILALVTPYVDVGIFYLSYANLTGLAFVLIVAALIVFPEILEDITEAAQQAYARSTLAHVDVDRKLTELSRLMDEDKLFQNEDLDLGTLADALALSSHQLSEMVNTRFGHGFSRYLREQRVNHARQELLSEPRASVLSVGLSAGFRSQSNFYTAFRDVTGRSPGEYRKAAARSAKDVRDDHPVAL